MLRLRSSFTACPSPEQPFIAARRKRPALRRAAPPRRSPSSLLPRSSPSSSPPWRSPSSSPLRRKPSSSRHTGGARSHAAPAAVFMVARGSSCSPSSHRPGGAPRWAAPEEPFTAPSRRSPSPHRIGGAQHHPCPRGALQHRTAAPRRSSSSRHVVLLTAPHRTAPKEPFTITVPQRSPFTALPGSSWSPFTAQPRSSPFTVQPFTTLPRRSPLAAPHPRGALHRIARFFLQPFVVPPQSSPSEEPVIVPRRRSPSSSLARRSSSSLRHTGGAHGHGCAGGALLCAAQLFLDPFRHITQEEAFRRAAAEELFIMLRGSSRSPSSCRRGGALHHAAPEEPLIAPPERSPSPRCPGVALDHAASEEPIIIPSPEEPFSIAPRRPAPEELLISPHGSSCSPSSLSPGGAFTAPRRRSPFTAPPQRSASSPLPRSSP